MVPGYLSVVTGFTIAELDEGGRGRVGRIALMTGLFTLGFGTVRSIILKALERTGCNYTEAARLLGVHPNNLHRLIRNLNLKVNNK